MNSRKLPLKHNALSRDGQKIFDAAGRDIIEIAEEESFMVARVAERIGLTVREFEGALDRSLGIKPKDLFRNRRALLVRRHIQEGMNLREIAVLLGFRHYSHFATEMKGFYGIPPVQLQSVVRSRCAN
jgi:AraC-like DNA-binding protein